MRRCWRRCIARGRTGQGRGDQRVAVRRDGGLDDGAAAAARGRQVAEAHRPRASLDLALWRVQDQDGADILISIQNDREWRILAEDVMGDAALAADPEFATVVERVERRAETDGKVAAGLRHDGCRGAVGEACGRRYRVRARQRRGGADRASASAAHQRRDAERAGVVSGARADPRSARRMAACRRSASTPRRCGRNSECPGRVAARSDATRPGTSACNRATGPASR